MMLSTLTPRQAAAIFTLGLMTFVTIGVTACLAIIAGAIYLCVSFVLLVLQSTIETLSLIVSTYSASNSSLKFVLLLLLFLVVYLVYRTIRKKGISAWIKL